MTRSPAKGTRRASSAKPVDSLQAPMAERHAAQLKHYPPATAEKFGPRDIPFLIPQYLPGGQTHWIDQGRGDLVSVVERGIGEHLMQICSMSFALFFCETPPTSFVQLGKMSLVFRINHMNRVPVVNNNIGAQVPESSVTGDGPIQREHRLAQASDFDFSACYCRFFADNCFDVFLPKPVKRQLPGKPVEFTPARTSAVAAGTPSPPTPTIRTPRFAASPIAIHALISGGRRDCRTSSARGANWFLPSLIRH
jgi:hypothetical protein